MPCPNQNVWKVINFLLTLSSSLQQIQPTDLLLNLNHTINRPFPFLSLLLLFPTFSLTIIHLPPTPNFIFAAAGADTSNWVWPLKVTSSCCSTCLEVGRSLDLMAFLGTQQKCKVCDKTVYVMDQLTADGVSYHKSCFKCSHCKGTLKVSAFVVCTTFFLKKKNKCRIIFTLLLALPWFN